MFEFSFLSSMPFLLYSEVIYPTYIKSFQLIFIIFDGRSHDLDGQSPKHEVSVASQICS